METKEERLGAYFTRKVCYCCEQPYEMAHPFYKEMCPLCGELNYRKRMQRSNLAGYRALITGGRVKIGFETARLLLEMGAEVVVTTRFPNDALKRYSLLPCFSEAKDRLKIIGADFRSISSITNLIQVLKEKPLDILINNAAQTVRRPVPFYKHLWEAEKLPPAVEDVICQMKHIGTGENAFFPEIIGNGLNSVALSQLRILPEDNDDNNETFFPEGLLDKDGQQLDLRPHNSWMYQMEEVPLLELYEVLQINLVTPFILMQQLLPLMSKPDRAAFIVNVSAMECNFYAPRKNTRHVHTNMAKAALNMITRTVAPHYKDYNVFMNSVDTGWITNEKPNPQNLGNTERKAQMAIDEIDGAMRILDPVLQGVNGAQTYGKLFKNYREYPW